MLHASNDSYKIFYKLDKFVSKQKAKTVLEFIMTRYNFPSVAYSK